MKITKKNGILHVYTPYNPDFVQKIKRIGHAEFDWDKRCWCVREEFLNVVREIMEEVYGYSDISENEAVTLEVTFNNEASEWTSDVVLFGKVIAHASHRDSGAKIGDDVAFKSGGADSGGSAKYYKSIVEKGSVVVLSNVNKKVYERSKVPYDVTVKVIEDKVNKQQLLAEKERLSKRIETIDKILGEPA